VIIGSGAAGLAAAHALLSRADGRERIILLEAGDLRTTRPSPPNPRCLQPGFYVNSGVTPAGPSAWGSFRAAWWVAAPR
jgi:2-polyprenyl-6-methoxyphenol hydroxylase-like FAD-dependent oxidoreductase